VLLLLSTCCYSSATFHTTKNPYHYSPLLYKPIKHGSVLDILKDKWDHAHNMAVLEQTVEDYNAEIVATAPDAISALLQRRLIVLPMDERFDPPMGMFSHGHVQTGDKMSMPRVFWKAIMDSKAEVPWLFEVSRVDGVTSDRDETLTGGSGSNSTAPCLNKIVGGAIDFRSPSNFIFLPKWMFQALSLKPYDVVDVKLITTVPPGSVVKLRPHSSEFLKIANHQAVLETELKHYSSLCKDTVIAFDYNKKRYFFDVVELRSAMRGEKAPMVKVQDCDIVAEFVRAKDQMKKKK